VAIEMNKKAFDYGCLAAHEPQKIDDMVGAVKGEGDNEEPIAQALDDVIAKRIKFLTSYQNQAYAKRYEAVVDRVRNAEQKIVANSEALTMAVARYYAKLLSYKDEYEVARLYTNGDFLNDLKKTFGGDYKLSFHLAPPIMEQTDPATGRPKKREFGPWMMQGFKVLAKMSFLRGTMFDVFGYSHERKEERGLITQYEHDVETMIGLLSPQTIDMCVEWMSLPNDIRGYGPVKEGNMKKATAKRTQLMEAIANGTAASDSEKMAA